MSFAEDRRVDYRGTMSTRFRIDSPGETLKFGEVGRPTVIVSHDWFGRLPWLTAFANSLVMEGFRVLVPDHYHGWATTDPGEAGAMMAALDTEEALKRLDALLLSSAPARVALLGFSLGGRLSIMSASRGGADALVTYYGSAAASEHGIIPCPVLLQLAEIDDWAPTRDPEHLMTRLRDHGTSVTEFTYAGAQHGFANEQNPAAYDRNTAALAFARTVAFLNLHLSDAL
ncbi:dienelactone hydrolase family protein [Alpinimonas psychrophila]|uniref:Carboxymethylenebutenolidase n=1 Tax=Alpinimonas psychrophila TaxID=748908 RepID=A0A7W3JUD1_9MICO|nr:dienelactone hydrolase family protein [Alpinimonas psychrophila]MBA8829436.1 carboxymethylenebutenolidase [Alpinimonas psychrophila]